MKNQISPKMMAFLLIKKKKEAFHMFCYPKNSRLYICFRNITGAWQRKIKEAIFLK
jgi:hypothetical protein